MGLHFTNELFEDSSYISKQNLVTDGFPEDVTSKTPEKSQK